MKDFLLSLKQAFIFVGTVIGAGFATGEEIKVYFASCNLFTVVFSALIFSLLFVLISYVSSLNLVKNKGRLSIVSRYATLSALLISIMAMSGASEGLLYSMTGIKGGGIATFVVCYACTLKDGKWLGIVNYIAVPLIVVLVVAIFVKVDTGIDNSGNFGFISGIGYACMNIFCAGVNISKQGGASGKKLVVSGVFTFVVLTVLMVAIKVSINGAVGSLPLVGVASGVGLKKIAELVVYLAIFTTMLGNLSASVYEVKSIVKSRVYTFTFLSFVALVGIFIGFTNIVTFGYPVISFWGVIYVIYTLILLVFRRKFLFNKGDYSVHTTG